MKIKLNIGIALFMHIMFLHVINAFVKNKDFLNTINSDFEQFSRLFFWQML